MMLKVHGAGQIWQRMKGTLKGHPKRPPVTLEPMCPRAPMGPKYRSEALLTRSRIPLNLTLI